METSTIQQIRYQIDQVDKALSGFVVRQHSEARYGPEEEYTAKSLKEGVKAILTDIRGLIRAHNKFVQLSIHSERDAIRGHLADIYISLTNEDYAGVASHLDTLKPVIRSFNVRGSSETQEVLEERADQFNAQCSVAEENIDTIEKIADKAGHTEKKLQSAEESIESFYSKISKLQEETEKLENLQDRSRSNHRAIEQALMSARSHEETINNFVQRVEKREQQLDKQEQSTVDYQEQLTSFKKEHEEKLEQAEKLIQQARNALGYTTATGISAAFSERYREEEGRGKKIMGWLVGAGIFVVTSIVIGIWLVWGNQAIGLGSVISRIAIMSVALSGAWFCAAQYVKYRNTREDYGYKTVLSRSMIAFLDQLTGEERERYLEMVLTEIHKDPLRKRHDESDSVGQKVMGTFRRGKKKNVESKSVPNDPSD